MQQTYFKYIGLYLLLFLCSVNFYAQNNPSVWVKTNKDNALKASKPLRQAEIKKASYYQLDIDKLKAKLKNAPNRKNSNVSNVVIRFPNKEGKLQPYRIKEAPLLENSFQEKHPDMRSFVGKHVNNSGESIRFSITPQGFHGMVLSSNKSAEFIDPVGYGSKSHMIYTKSDLSDIHKTFECKVVDNSVASKLDSIEKSSAAVNANDGTLRTYELALASTGEYSNFHIDLAGLPPSASDSEKKDVVKAAMMVTINRVNGIFERDLSLTMVMVDNTDIIFLNAASDPYTNDNGISMLSENQSEVDGTIGSANYDIGHVFSTGGGGVAELGSSCITATKAQGVTGLSAPIGDVFDVEFVAHELGHQYGANHTWSSGSNGCTAGQWESSSSYEPGSGTTIMSYAGLCAPDNVQFNADDYFHVKSIQEIFTHISGNNCTDESSAGNLAPISIAGSNYTIPISTPFKLTGDSSDQDPSGVSTHTYTWEQYDLATSQGSILEGNTTGPLVRSYAPSSNPVRYIPNLNDLRISNGSTTWEKLASVPRTLNFQLTVRDNGSGGDYGQTDSDAKIITVVDVDEGRPFQVTSQNTNGISYPIGSTQIITWDVAGTTGGGINTSNVNIWLSIDGGLTYPTLLANTANDGMENVTFPGGIVAPFCRLMVEADPAENIFFAINEEDFAIGYTVTETCIQQSSSPNLPIPDDSPGSGMQGTAVGDDINILNTGTISSIKVNVDIDHTFISDLVVNLRHPDNSTTMTLWSGNCTGASQGFDIIFEDGASEINCNPANISGTYRPSTPLNIFNGLSSSGSWLLFMADFEPTQSGSLVDWYIDMCITNITLSNSEIISKEAFKIYPNPNKGIFTMELQNLQSSEVHIEVYDIQGRRILEKSFTNTGTLKEDINLSNAQSGMYILNLKDGVRQTSRKIIIE